ncbi:uncharacterized protein KY384_000860 [Bacidia gigantensis]|uniref:uncharacterized protein n=1 Tax=Bacidia gigantensis TaxID=2732470 RepID=UPI001D056355|nr:uncharacterized protein KY384_000860 [Bacidia gigantensis]KAG8534018.1 hypothetical protein KY384_000860 [Bacidia gigantensis]
MGINATVAAVKDYLKPPKTLSADELTARADQTILESESTKSEDAQPKGKNNAASSGGLECTVKNLYMDKRGQWTDKYPYFVKNPPENQQTISHAVIVRNKRSTDSRKKFEIESIVVQSPLLKRALHGIFTGYPGITTDLERLEFKAPFPPFVHRWREFEQATVNETDLATKQHLALLWNILEVDLKDKLQKMKDYARHNIIDAELLWTLFEPDCLVLSSKDGSERLYRCLKVDTENNDCCTIEAQYVDWDGERFGTAMTSLALPSFRGTKPLTRLNAMPLSRHPNKTDIEQRILQRGKTFESLRGYHFKAYDGLGQQDVDGQAARYNVQGRIIIDTAAYNLFNPNSQVQVSSFQTKGSNNEKGGSRNRPLSRENLLLSRDTVRAYSLKDKKWLSVFINDVTEVAWDDAAFDSLVLNGNTKDLILAFAESQVKRQPTFDDVIKGKGRGTIMLLSGPPGVGKTLTAESVAEVMKVPLYMLSAGDLGTDPVEVDKTLNRTLEMTTKWRAVLLLDEADVFLLSRNAHDLERNKLVSIFLRVLEYYEGFLFLTTNRIQDIDAAFESRIHLSLQYEDLGPQGRKHVWKSFLQTCETAHGEFSDEKLRVLAQHKLNGRQIKNVVKPALLLAARQNQPLKFEHVDTVLQIKAANAFSYAKMVPVDAVEG